MNQLNQKAQSLRIQIEAEKQLVRKGKGSKERVELLKKELKECLQQLI